MTFKTIHPCSRQTIPARLQSSGRRWRPLWSADTDASVPWIKRTLATRKSASHPDRFERMKAESRGS
ncbi:MAG: hypothetical protein LBQ81_04420 [Zoogloeaceae bacterium]|nr:hypothetical protein [Zoogloeaceae bacterium]